MNGEKFTSDSLKGNVVLLQFWATWCHVCREQESVVDTIAEEFADRGLVVLAVDHAESKRTVKQYLNSRPRSCKVVLTEDTNLAAIFPTRAVPYYVLIDRNGRVIASSAGGGEGWLRQVLGRAFATALDPVNVSSVARAVESDSEPAPLPAPSQPIEPPSVLRREAPAAPTVPQAPALPPPPPAPALITVRGVLSRVDCLGEMARLHVLTGRASVALLIRRPDQVTITGGTTRELRCGPQKTAVSVEYVAGNDGKYATIGDLRAIEFISAP